MQIILRTPNIHINDREREYIEKKLLHLEKLSSAVADEASKIHIDIMKSEIKTTDHTLIFQGTLYIPHGRLRAESKGVTVEEATDFFIDKMKRQIRKFKTRTVTSAIRRKRD